METTTRSAIVTEQLPSPHSRLSDWYRNADLLDSYLAKLPAGSEGKIRRIAQAFFEQPAPWFIRKMLSVSDGFSRHMMQRKPVAYPSADQDQDQINLLPVLSEHDDELIVGKDDPHMNFRISVMIQKSVGGPDLISVTTVVRCNTRRGRLYLGAIRPFHRYLVPSNLRRTVETCSDLIAREQFLGL